MFIQSHFHTVKVDLSRRKNRLRNLRQTDRLQLNKATYDIDWNPNGSVYAIEGITSPDGRVLGKMGHSERIGKNVSFNVPGNKDQKLFEAGVKYFK